MDSQGRLAAEKADSKAAEARRVYDQRLTREIEDSWFGFVPWKTTEAIREKTLEGVHQEGCHARAGVSALTEVASSMLQMLLRMASELPFCAPSQKRSSMTSAGAWAWMHLPLHSCRAW